MAPTSLPRGRRVLVAVVLLAALAVMGWFAFAYGAAGLVLRSGPCAGRASMDALLAAWLAFVVAAAGVPPVLLLVRGRWQPAVRALAAGVLGAGAFYGAAFLGMAAFCGG